MMFAVGHLALGYILGKATSWSLNVNLNVPLVLVASIIADTDLLVPWLEHRGPSHSLILILLFFLPAFALYRKNAAPYFVAAVQHSIPGDHLTGGGTQLLWPLTSNWYGFDISMLSLTSIFIELTSFLVFLVITFKTKDVLLLFQQHSSNLLLFIPIFTVLLPTMLSFPLAVPWELVTPHIAYLLLFTFSILVDLQHILSDLVHW